MNTFIHPLDNFEQRTVITEEQFLVGIGNTYFRELMYRTYQVPLDLFYKHVDKVEKEIFWICSYQRLSEDDMNSRDFLDAIDRVESYHCWVFLSALQKLSEDFIERHYNDVAWDHVCYSQELSEEFVKKTIKKFRRTATGIIASLQMTGKWTEQLSKDFPNTE